MSQIDDKYADLQHHGINLGAPKGPERDAGSGGRVREYASGNVYYHPNTGAHEVHGGILSLYLAAGGPGANPATGNRDLGYPITDENPGETPFSMFEWGAIYWARGTGGVVLYGSIYLTYQATGGMGMPLSSVGPVAGGLAAYFEGGVIFSANGGGNVHKVLVGHLSTPLLGSPRIADPAVEETRRFRNMVVYRDLLRADFNALVAWRPSIFTDLWKERLVLTPVGAPTRHLTLVPFQTHADENPQILNEFVDLEAFGGGPVDLQDRTLYDLRIALPNGTLYNLSPHCLYAKKTWESFGMMHVTDIHVNSRNEGFRAKFNAIGQPGPAGGYSNFEDNFRDFIRYANHLHGLGMVDLVWATGDLVDYVQEESEPGGWDNFRRLRNLLLGQPMNDGDLAGEELTMPFFSTFGNHDYRVGPYNLTEDIDPAFDIHATGVDEFSDHNITESEALALQNGHRPSFGITSLGDALQALQWDRFDNAYGYYKSRFAAARSYVVPLGVHRLVMLDTRSDDGVPAEINLAFLIDLITNSLPAETQRIIDTNSANLIGLSGDDLNLLRGAIGQAGQDGLVVVGIHAPAIDQSGEYAYYLRETIHPSADGSLISEYVQRHKLNGATWPTGTPFFKTGDSSDGLDGGTFNANVTEFLKTCAGVGLPRPVDLILCGHKHQWVEHRFAWNAGANRLEFYCDHYTENPASYYSTVNGFDGPSLPKGSRIQVHIEAGATLPPPVTVVRDHRGGIGAPPGVPATVYGSAKLPPYADPLISTADPKAWWKAHRPLHAMTSALGPIESRQRYGTFYKVVPPDHGWRPIVESDTPPTPHLVLQGRTPVMQQVLPQAGPLTEPTFQGFRVIQVGANVIQKMHYVTLAELRARGFKMPFEPAGGRDRFGDVIAHGGLQEVLRAEHLG